jgi:hypothetical protein
LRFTVHLLILIWSGSQDIGVIEEGNGFGSQVIGREDPNPMPFGSQVGGSPEEMDGSGFRGIGNIGNIIKAIQESRLKN